MAKINILDSSVYNLISAGEVVERPASVVKELLENSVDAGAQNLTLEIKDGGTTFIEVADDGCGIEEDDVKSAFLPHATSKIKCADDLDSILTLGFRGEALASIAAVSKVTLVSKTEQSELATSISVEGGKFGKIEKVAGVKGTKICVRDLFYCVPARLKFLKKPKTEEQEITNIVSRMILAHPKLNIKYIVDGKTVFDSRGKNEKEAMFVIYGKESVTETLELNLKRGNISVFGYVGKPTFSKSNRTYQTLIVNGRYVINLTVQTAVTNAFGDYLMKRQYPFFVIYLNLPSTDVDVNVHPNKLDVKFVNSGAVYSAVFDAVSKALYDMDYVKEISEEEKTNSNESILSFSAYSSPKKPVEKIDRAGVSLNLFNRDEKIDDDKSKTNLNKNPFSDRNSVSDDKKIDNVIDAVIDMNTNEPNTMRDNFGIGSKLLEQITKKMDSGNYDDPFKDPSFINSKNPSDKNASPSENNIKDNGESKFFKGETAKNYEPLEFVKEKSVQNDFAKDELKIVGKIFNTYLIVEWGNNIYLFDQHAVHERIRYEKLKSEYESGKMAIQPLLMPYILTLNAQDEQILEENLDALKSVGFEIDEYGENTYRVSSVPAIVSDMDFNKFFGMFLAEKLNKNKISEAELVKDKLMQMACKTAVKGGDDLTKFEIEKLLSDMGNQNIILFCPHGRPVVVKISKSEIEKWFKRIV